MDKKLTKKEKEFCSFYAKLRNAREAASLAGYKIMPAICGERLLSKELIRKEILKLTADASYQNEAIAGFRRIAFGSICDAVRLVDGDRTDLESMDLFMVSDIKLPKGGGMEIKFFDRQKALESLALIESRETSDNAAIPFYKALERSADLLSGTPENNALDEVDE